MNKSANIYVTGKMCAKWGHFADVYLNGVKINGASKAKSGPNGFIEVPKWPLDTRKMADFVRKHGELPLKRIRGNVKITFKPKGERG